MRAGEVGTIRVVVLANGQIQADARMRDKFGALCRLKVLRATEEEARRALDEQSDLVRNDSTGPTLSAYSTIAEARAVFLDDKRRSQTVEVSTIETYEFSVNNVIIPECGNLLLTDLSVLRCNRILQHIRDTKSLSAARKARSMFSQICATGIVVYISVGLLLGNFSEHDNEAPCGRGHDDGGSCDCRQNAPGHVDSFGFVGQSCASHTSAQSSRR